MKNFLVVFFTSFFPLIYSSADVGDFKSKTHQCTFERYLKNFVRRQGKAYTLNPVNTFSVSTMKEMHPEGEFWVLWHEQKKLLLVYWPLSSKEFCKDGQPGRRVLDLTKDIVKTPEDIRGSTYLVDEGWASKVVFDALVRGPTFRVSK